MKGISSNQSYPQIEADRKCLINSREKMLPNDQLTVRCQIWELVGSLFWVRYPSISCNSIHSQKETNDTSKCADPTGKQIHNKEKSVDKVIESLFLKSASGLFELTGKMGQFIKNIDSQFLIFPI